MTKTKVFDLEDRTQRFANDCRLFVKTVPNTAGNDEDSRQLIRSSGSVGANYIEANEALSKKDFIMRIKICRKESKESRYWFSLIETKSEVSEKERLRLFQEAIELTKIFGSILENSY